MIRNARSHVTVGLSMAALLVLGMMTTHMALASDPHEPVEATFQTTGTIVLKQSLRAGDFMLLKDVTPLQVVGGHVAMKVPCDRNGETSLHVLVGSAGEARSVLVPVELETIKNLSKPGRDCVYHADLDLEDIQQEMQVREGIVVNVTDIALANSDENRRVRFGSDNGSTVTVNLLTTAGEDDHHDDE